MNNNLEKNLARLADKLAEVSQILGTEVAADPKSYKAYVAVAEAQSILWMIGRDTQDDINKLGEELEAKLLRKGWI